MRRRHNFRPGSPGAFGRPEGMWVLAQRPGPSGVFCSALLPEPGSSARL